jgi:hypothetical protein
MAWLHLEDSWWLSVSSEGINKNISYNSQTSPQIMKNFHHSNYPTLYSCFKTLFQKVDFT